MLLLQSFNKGKKKQTHEKQLRFTAMYTPIIRAVISINRFIHEQKHMKQHLITHSLFQSHCYCYSGLFFISGNIQCFTRLCFLLRTASELLESPVRRLTNLSWKCDPGLLKQRTPLSKLENADRITSSLLLPIVFLISSFIYCLSCSLVLSTSAWQEGDAPGVL